MNASARRSTKLCFGATTQVAILCTAVGCITPYQPAELELGRVPADGFERVLDVVRAQYPRLFVMDAQRFRIQSAWIEHEREGVPGEKRATLFLDPPGKLNAVVEVRYLCMDVLGMPRWTSITADPALEWALLDAIDRVMLQRDS